MIKTIALISLAILSLSGCDQVMQRLGIEDAGRRDARQEAEGKAVGSACRHSGRAIEDCYSIYNWLPKSPIYTGWREMDAYMRENQIETIAPQLPPPEPPTKKKKKAGAEETSEDKAGGKAEGSAPEAGQEKAASKH